MNHALALIAFVILIGILGLSIITFASMMREHSGPQQQAADANNRQLDFMQSLVMTYGALLPIYVPDLYAHLREHQQSPARCEDE
ncbi:hypothetical protein [Brucella pituitosa]|uniref:hypothetical protein n=1 Tax=Brucella pituitosa TaxID=571256 RepID=UPI0009A1D4E8|nr:hypothetical protein [Brucella pituitosa]